VTSLACFAPASNAAEGAIKTACVEVLNTFVNGADTGYHLNVLAKFV